LRSRKFVHAVDDENSAEDEAVEIHWLNPAGDEMSDAQWGESFARCVGLSLTDKQTRRSLFMIFNASRESIGFLLPPTLDQACWFCKLNTANASVVDVTPDSAEGAIRAGDKITVAAASVLVYSTDTASTDTASGLKASGEMASGAAIEASYNKTT